MKLPIYLDYAATTPVDERVAKEMMQCLTMDGNLVTLHHAHTVLVGKQKKQLIKHVQILLI